MATDRFNLDTYQQGDDDWSHTDTVELLDELAVETDTIANRPESGSYDDELFFATDQKLLYRWDDSEEDWLVEGGVGNSTNRLPSLWADTVNSNVTKHATDISEDYVVDSGEGAVFAGPITGSGSISGDGQVSVIQEGHQFTDNVDAQGNDINNVGTLEAGQANITALHEFNFEDKSDETSNRSFSTTYQNTNEYTLAVVVDSNMSAGTDQDFRLSFFVGQSSSLENPDGVKDTRVTGVDFAFRDRAMVIVPPGYYYELRAADNPLTNWFEGGLRE